MQTPKDYIRNGLTRAAEELFFEKGYLGVSMRAVAAKSGVGLSNIYNYFKSKDALFRAVVEPAASGLERMIERHYGHACHDITDIRTDTYYKFMVNEYADYINRNRRRLAILLLKAQGSSLARYKTDFIRHATATVKQCLAEMKLLHHGIGADIPETSIRMHTIWIFSMLEEIITCNVSQDDVPRVVGEYMAVEFSGWRELLKI